MRCYSTPMVDLMALFVFVYRDGLTGELIRTLTGHTLGVISVSFSMDGTRNWLYCLESSSVSYFWFFLGVASSSIDSTVRVWEEGGECIQTIQATPVEAWSAQFHPDGKSLATGSHDGHINVYDIDSGEKVASLATKNNFVMCTAYVSRQGKWRGGTDT